MFGCHTALVLRRLRRICARLYNVHPTFVVTSATVANPREHVQNLLGGHQAAALSVDNTVVCQLDMHSVTIPAEARSYCLMMLHLLAGLWRAVASHTLLA